MTKSKVDVINHTSSSGRKRRKCKGGGEVPDNWVKVLVNEHFILSSKL